MFPTGLKTFEKRFTQKNFPQDIFNFVIDAIN